METRILCFRISHLRARTKPVTPCFDAQYAEYVGPANRPAIEETVIMWPLVLDWIMRVAACFEQRKTLVRFVSISLCHWSVVMSMTWDFRPQPALFMRMSILLNFFITELRTILVKRHLNRK